MAISDLPRDLLKEVLSRVTLRSLRAVRSTCTNWNILSNDESFTKKLFGKAITAKGSESLVITMMDFRVYLMSVNLCEIHNEDDDVESSIKHKGKFISLNDGDLDRVDISRVFHCDALLLCITEDINSRLVIWNPYSGQTKLIKPRNPYHIFDRYALGYERKKNRSYKILRFNDKFVKNHQFYEFEIYDLNSDSWKVIDFSPDWDIQFYHRGVSIQGNTYWFAQEFNKRRESREIRDFLICFYFTREKFGPRLSLPFHSYVEDTVTLSSVRDEQLAVLLHRRDTLMLEIWITAEIQPAKVKWKNLLLAVNMTPLTRLQFQPDAASFFVDEEKKLVVVLGKDMFNPTRNLAYIIGKDGYFKQVDLGESTYSYCCPLVCSYVPSSVQIKQPIGVKQQQKQHRSFFGIMGFWWFGFSIVLCILLSYLCFV